MENERLLTDAEVMREAEDFLSHRDSVNPAIRGATELCMFAERIAWLTLAKEYEKIDEAVS